jgi:hypothetical protein
MRMIALLSIVLLLSLPAIAQLTITSTTPANGAVSVSTTTTLSITFSGPVDTTQKLGGDLGILSNIDAVSSQWYSADRRSAYFNVQLQANHVYFFCVYWAPGDGGANMAIPQGVVFTTASAFPSSGYEVSGTISGGSTGISPSYALVALADGPVTGGKPNMIIGTIADASGNFSFSGIPAGTYWPIAIKDINADGYLDPGSGDPLAMGDSIIVTNAAVTGVGITFTVLGPITFHEAVDRFTNKLKPSLPSDILIHMVYCWEADTTGLGSGWSIYCSSPSEHKYYRAEIGTVDLRVETVDDFSAQWFKDKRPISSPAAAAAPESIVVRTEIAGGRDWRWTAGHEGQSFKLQLTLSDPRNSPFGDIPLDTSKIYWGVEYMYGVYPAPDSFVMAREKKFAADFTTGNIVGSTAAVRDNEQTAGPVAFTLDQNYPNPFNPTTSIGYSVGVVSGQWSVASRVRLAVYDLLGREVAVLVDAPKEPGVYTATWNAAGMASGVYIYRLTTNDYTLCRSMVLLK